MTLAPNSTPPPMPKTTPPLSENHDRADYHRSLGWFYSSGRWRRLRRLILAAHPLCQAPGCYREATDVDHIIPMAAGGPALDADNLQALCHECHSRKTQGDAKRGATKCLVKDKVIGGGEGENLTAQLLPTASLPKKIWSRNQRNRPDLHKQWSANLPPRPGSTRDS